MKNRNDNNCIYNNYLHTIHTIIILCFAYTVYYCYDTKFLNIKYITRVRIVLRISPGARVRGVAANCDGVQQFVVVVVVRRVLGFDLFAANPPPPDLYRV